MGGPARSPAHLPPPATTVRCAWRISTTFAYADASPFVPVGTTCYVWNLQGDAPEEQTLRTLERAPFNKLLDPGVQPFARGTRAIDTIMREGPWNCTAGGYHEDDYFIFYFGHHQPGFRNLDLPAAARYRVDVIDTWNMTVDCIAEAASGPVTVPLPARQYMALRIQKA
jgi:hypothetical protein